jgi:AcrR family transcriptional regulator
VGARAGVTRGAPYRHFADKESLLTAVATERWERVSDQVHALRTDPGLPASEKLRGALHAMIDVGRDQPHLYRMMCTAPAGNPTAAVRSQDELRAIVASLVGEPNAGHYGALLLAGSHGIAGMELSGYLADGQWHTTVDEVIETLVRMVTQAGETA